MYPAILKLSRAMAVVGGIVLTVLILLTCVSVAGRLLNGVLHSAIEAETFAGLAQALLDIGIGPLNGDFELVEAGMAFAVFAFLPLCQLTGGHATVDIFTSRLGAGPNRVLAAVIETVFAAVLILIAVQLFGGLQTKFRTEQTTFLLQFPLWWAYATSLVGAVLAAGVASYVAVMRVLEMLRGVPLLPIQSESET